MCLRQSWPSTACPPRAGGLAVALGRAEPATRSEERSLVGLAVADVLRSLVSTGPVLLAIDDIQWMDRASERGRFGLRRAPARPGGGRPCFGPKDAAGH